MQISTGLAVVVARGAAALLRLSSRLVGHGLLWRVIHRAARRLFASTICVVDGYVFTAYGVWIRQRPMDRTFEFYVRGVYGFYLSDYLSRQDQPFMFLDIGANAGLYSVLAAKNSFSLAVHAFEPDPDTVPFLRANLAREECVGWTIHQVALSDRSGRGDLMTSSHHSGIATLRGNEVEGQPFDGRVTVPLKDHHYLDAFLGGSDALARVLVKIDVEGHELSVLRGLARWRHWDSVSAIYLELDSAFADTASTIDFLHSYGFMEQHREGTGEHYDALYTR